MLSTLYPGAPEVELRFEAAGSTFTLQKRFSGSTGFTRLSDSAGVCLQNDEAESRLAGILVVEALRGGRGVGDRAAQQWAHLWVWQGEAGDDPSAHATAEQSRLIQRLQSLGGAAALQSELDARVARRFAESRDSIFTQPGKPKTTSDYGRVEQAVTIAEVELGCATARVQKLEQASTDFENASRDLATAAEDLQRLRKEQQTVESKFRELADLRHQEREQHRDVDDASGRHKDLERASDMIAATRQKFSALQQAIAPHADKVRQLEQSRDESRQRLAEVEAQCRGSADASRMARLRYDFAVAQAALFEKATLHSKLTEKAQTICDRRKAIGELEKELAQLPEVTRSRLENVQRLQAECGTAAAALRAMAAGLEVLASDQRVLAGGNPIETGQRRVLTEDTEVRIGDSIRLRIQPGGGTSLSEACGAEHTARLRLQECLDGLGLASVQSAVDAHTRRDSLNLRLETARAELEGMGAAQLDDELQNAQNDLDTARGNVDRLQVLVPDLGPPTDKSAARALVDVAEQALRHAEEAEELLKATRGTCAEIFEAKDVDLNRHRQDLEKQKRELSDLNAQLRLLLDTHGNDDARCQAMAHSETTWRTAEASLKASQEAIAALQPELLEADRVRLARAVEQKANERIDADKRRAIAHSTLRSDGAEDPRAALADAQARARSAIELRDNERRRARAIERLHDLFQQEQRALATQFTQPLAEKVAGYLQCLFGPEARAAIALENNQFTGLRLFRPASDGAELLFDDLSGGAREQVAAAVRLAMAEVLAADHDGCLPVVFDDAFAYSDPDRVIQLQRMLDLAASRGLQVIILTCNPSDYAALGARSITLQPPPRRQALAPADHSAVMLDSVGENPDSGDEVAMSTQSPPIVTAELREAFLAALSAAGGSKGNQSLRLELRWDEATYNSVRSDLIAAGTVFAGRGRGGSVVRG
jgi:DNA repair exonuclease SbcCD ATPase subunit